MGMALAEPVQGDEQVEDAQVYVDRHLQHSLDDRVTLDWDEGFLLLGAQGC